MPYRRGQVSYKRRRLRTYSRRGRYGRRYGTTGRRRYSRGRSARGRYSGVKRKTGFSARPRAKLPRGPKTVRPEVKFLFGAYSQQLLRLYGDAANLVIDCPQEAIMIGDTANDRIGNKFTMISMDLKYMFFPAINFSMNTTADWAPTINILIFLVMNPNNISTYIPFTTFPNYGKVNSFFVSENLTAPNASTNRPFYNCTIGGAIKILKHIRIPTVRKFKLGVVTNLTIGSPNTYTYSFAPFNKHVRLTFRKGLVCDHSLGNTGTTADILHNEIGIMQWVDGYNTTTSGEINTLCDFKIRFTDA